MGLMKLFFYIAVCVFTWEGLARKRVIGFELLKPITLFYIEKSPVSFFHMFSSVNRGF